jgi:NAD+ synthase
MEKFISSKEKAEKLVEWIRNYAKQSNIRTLVVGISGGIDSALVSTLCAMTGLETVIAGVSVIQPEDNVPMMLGHKSLGKKHAQNLMERFQNVVYTEIEMSSVFDEFRRNLLSTLFTSKAPFEEEGAEIFTSDLDDELALANSRSRLRMVALYQIATCMKGLVVGTGNKVEDFGVGFFTKYGDGGVDISPIACLTKTQVREIATEVGVIQEILDAKPTDGLWADGRTDEDQIGATYPELEWAMEWYEKNPGCMMLESHELYTDQSLKARELEVLLIYKSFHKKNAHKMRPIPVPSL